MMTSGYLRRLVESTLKQRRNGKSVITDVQKAFLEGRKAYLKGIKEKDCPYESTQPLRSAWHAGWQVEEVIYVDEIMEKMRSKG